MGTALVHGAPAGWSLRTVGKGSGRAAGTPLRLSHPGDTPLNKLEAGMLKLVTARP